MDKEGRQTIGIVASGKRSVLIMVRIGRAIKRWVMCLSAQERKKKGLRCYRQEINRLQSMETGELDLEYINTKIEYEHKKIVLSIFLLSIVLAVLMDVWKYFYTFIENMVRYNTTCPGNEPEVVQVVFAIFIILVIFISVVILGILIFYIRSMKRAYKKLLIIERLRKKRLSIGL